MKKCLKIVALLALVIIAATPFFVGMGLEYGFNLALRALQVEPQVVLGEAKFKRGYLSSSVHVDFKLLLEAQPQSLTLDIHLQHGPLLMGPRLCFGLLNMAGEIKVAAVTPQLGVGSLDQPIYSWVGTIGATGTGAFSDHYNPATLNFKQGQMRWSRGEGTGRLDMRLKRIDYEGHLSQLSWQSPDITMQLADANIAKQIVLSSSGLSWFSRAAFKAMNAQWNGDHYWFKNGALGISRSDQAATERWQLSLVSEEFKSDSMQLTSLDANLALDQMPPHVLPALASLMLSHEDDATFYQQAAALSREYLSSSPASLLIERFGALQEGKSFWFSARAGLEHLLGLPQEAWQDPQILLSQLVGGGEVHLQKELLRSWVEAYLAARNSPGNQRNFSAAQIDVFTQAFMGQGMLSDEGSMYGSKLVFDAGEITLNSKPMALPF
ncbi:MAG TPA: DUF945 family protein [Cellvibrionaceae bacterium]